MFSTNSPHPSAIWAKGNCRDAPEPDIFYPDRDAETYSDTADRARAYCRGDRQRPVCPVLLECLFYGLITEDDFGIWGGMSTRERNALRRTGRLSNYREADLFGPSPYRALIENYLEQQNGNQESKEAKGHQ